MRGRVGQITDALAANFWLVPLAAFAAAFGLSKALAVFDRSFDISSHAWFVYGGSPSGARSLLATIAGSMITFIGLVFSSTILVLQLASSQFSPRVMRSFFRDRIIQATLGTFIATFAYAVFVVREIREDPAHPFVPGVSTYGAITLVWLSLAMFVLYINHIGQRIRAVTIIETAAKETAATLARLSRHRPPYAPFVRPDFHVQIVSAPRHGSVSSVDSGGLVRLGAKIDAVLEVVPLIGDFLCTGAPTVRSGARASLKRRKPTGSLQRSRSNGSGRCGKMCCSASANSSTSPIRRFRPASTIPRPRSRSLISSTNSSAVSPLKSRARTSTGTMRELRVFSFRNRRGSSSSTMRWKRFYCTDVTRST